MLLELTDVGFSYKGAGRAVFSGVCFSIRRSEVFCLLGPNGCGKSTLLNCISGLYRPTEGNITIDGHNILEMSKKQLAALIGYVPQFHQPTYHYTVQDFVVLGRSPHIPLFGRPSKTDYAIADEAIEMLQIGHLRNQSYMHISGGERQLALFARVVAQRPALILLDEPTASLDFGNQLKIVNLAKQLAGHGFAILMTTHHPDHALIAANKVCLMNNAQVEVVGTPKDVIIEPILTKTYGTRVIVEYIDRIGRPVCVAVGEAGSFRDSGDYVFREFSQTDSPK